MIDIISNFLRERIDAGDFPSAVYLVAEKGEIVMQDALGLAVVEPERIEAQIDTIYDLASLTKPLVTGLLVARSIEDGDLAIGAEIRDFVPEAERLDLRITVRQLATHVSGMPAWIPLYVLAPSRARVIETICDIMSMAKASERVEYSDLGYILLSRSLTDRLDAEFEWKAIEGLDLADTFFIGFEQSNAVKNLQRRRIAASENGSRYERSICVAKGYIAETVKHHAFREHLIWGEVHDGNAYFMGGVAGHAGLFSTAEDVFKIAQQFLPNYSQLLRPETCELFRTNFTPGMNEDRSFAFQLASTKDSTAGTKMSPESFGHLGFTGTSLWIDPIKERVFILLTNRTHNRSLPFVNINSVRRRFHDLAIDILDRNS
ncbi:MAG: serine hydrolase [Pyrinomonadaceae bacterium]